MAVRQRFTPAERAAFTRGTAVEWLHGSHWQPGEITAEKPIRDPHHGWWEVMLKHTGPATRTISNGAPITGSPGAVRLAVTWLDPGEVTEGGAPAVARTAAGRLLTATEADALKLKRPAPRPVRQDT